MALTDQFSAFARWRLDVSHSIQQLRAWLSENDVGDAQSDVRLQYLLDRLKEEKLVVAFVAEFSRGKSELINAMFFSDYRTRILPSSAGRTTMCPTELQWEPGQSPGVRLLPIETRTRPESIAELRRVASEWVVQPIDLSDTEGMQRAVSRVSETKRVTREEAIELGFQVDDDGVEGARPDADGLVEVACWRHAIIQFPHPLLEQGLVIIDTPGLNAIGSEPELTLSLLPNAHAVLYILAADTGVTQSDLAIWQKYVTNGRSTGRGRVVVLNKIDGLWDGMRSDADIKAEIDKQVASVADTLAVRTDAVFPVSAQKALLARVNRDAPLLHRSRIIGLESALSQELLPGRQQLILENVMLESGDVIQRAEELLQARLRGLREQLQEMTDLRGKNQGVIEYMMLKVRQEKDEFETGLKKYHAVRSVFTGMSNKVFAHIGMDAVRVETRRTREAMIDARFTKGLREAMSGFFDMLRSRLNSSAREIDEITNMLDAMYKRFAVEHGLKLATPHGFSFWQYEREITRLEKAFNEQLNTVAVYAQWKNTVTQRFFETIALEARRTFEVANRDIEHWLRAVMAPLETQVREYQLHLRRRLDSVKRVHEATGTLEARIDELQQAEHAMLTQVGDLLAVKEQLFSLLGLGDGGYHAPDESAGLAA